MTSHIEQIMERILQKDQVLSPHQSGFRNGRGSMDPVVFLLEKA